MPRPHDSNDRPDKDRRRHPLKLVYGVVLPGAFLLAIAWFVPILSVDDDQLTVTFANGGGVVESADGTRTELAEGTAVRAGDRVVLQDGAAASFESVDGHHVSLSDSSTLVVEGTRRSLFGTRVHTEMGMDQGDVRVTGEGEEGTSLDIGLPYGVAGVRGTDVSVRVGQGQAAVSVHEGLIRISDTPGGKAELTGGQGAVLADTGPVVSDLPLAPMIRRLPNVINSEGIHLNWTSVPGVNGYLVSIGPDSAVQNVRFRSRTDSAFLELPVLEDEEPLFARVQGLTAQGLTGIASDPYKLNFAYHWAQARKLRDEGDTRASLDEFELALERRPENAELYREMGWYLYILGRHADALNAYERAREITPDETEMLVELARVHFWLRNYDEAEAIYQGVLEEQPDYPDALWGLGDTYRVLGRREEALDLVQRAVRLDPDHPYARATLRELRGGG